MRLSHLWSWFGDRDTVAHPTRRKLAKFRPVLAALEDRTVMNGYLAIGAGAGAQPLVAIRVDKQGVPGGPQGNIPNNAGEPVLPQSDGRTDFTSQIFLAYDKSFTGGVRVASGNFDGDFTTPDFLITAPGAGGGPHIKVYTMIDDGFGNITVGRLFTEFFAYDKRFTGGVNVTTGDLDGDGRGGIDLRCWPRRRPHVKVYKLDLSDQRAVLVNEFMAYEPSFRGGVSVSSGQGYQTPVQVRQVFSGDFPDDFFGYFDPPPLPPGPPHCPELPRGTEHCLHGCGYRSAR